MIPSSPCLLLLRPLFPDLPTVRSHVIGNPVSLRSAMNSLHRYTVMFVVVVVVVVVVYVEGGRVLWEGVTILQLHYNLTIQLLRLYYNLTMLQLH